MCRDNFKAEASNKDKLQKNTRVQSQKQTLMVIYRPMSLPQQRALRVTISSSLISISIITFHQPIIWIKRPLPILKKRKDQSLNKIREIRGEMIPLEGVDHLKGVAQLLKNK